MWQAFVHWFSQLIQYMYGLTVSMDVPSYGLAIIFMTILIKVALFPLTQKQMKSMRGMQEIQPDIKYLQEKYKESPEIMQKKMMELYKEKGVSPFGGCLPLLIQMPIFIAFYQSLVKFDFVVAEHAKFLWIPDLGASDPYYLLAVLAAATTFLQQKISMVNTDDPTQKSMLYVMPLFMGWIAATMPAGLPLYWIMFNILGILQQLYVNFTAKQAKLDTGTGAVVNASAKELQLEEQEKMSTEDNNLEEKGGKKKNENRNSGNKRKKRR